MSLNKTQIFANELIASTENKILAIGSFGSHRGENDLDISDIDFLIVCKTKKDINSVFNTGLKLQEKVFNTKITRVNRFIQKNFLGSNSYDGVHLIIFGRDEFDKNFYPRSLRLILLTKLIGRNIFLYEIKQNHHLLYGENFVNDIKIGHPDFLEKLTCFSFPILVLLLSLPTILFSRRTFKIWCFKAIKYHNMSLRAFVDIDKKNYMIDDSMLNIAKKFRYKPEEFKGSSIILYLQVWKNILGNIRFIFR